jgi:hypothetical protein
MMEDSVNAFAFTKLTHDIYLILEILMHVERSLLLEFMFGVNEQVRSFVKKHFISIRNGFINEGLIVYDFRCNFNHYYELERLY